MLPATMEAMPPSRNALTPIIVDVRVVWFRRGIGEENAPQRRFPSFEEMGSDVGKVYIACCRSGWDPKETFFVFFGQIFSLVKFGQIFLFR